MTADWQVAMAEAIEVYEAALDVVGTWPTWPAGVIEPELLAHHVAVRALREALERAGVLP